MKQIVAHEKLRPWQGLLLIAAVVAALIAVNFILGTFLQRLIGYTAASIAFWVIGAAIAYWVFRRYIASYSYELSADVLRLCRAYGKRERHICDIYLNRALFIGDAEEAKKRYGKLIAVRALRSGERIPVTAIVFDSSDGRRVALLHADAALKSALIERMRKK